MDNKVVNKIFNCIIIILIVIMFIVLVFNIIEPLKYDINTKTTGKKLDKSPYIYSALDKYIYAIKRDKTEDINKILPMVKRENKDIYSEYSNYINKNFETLNIISISEIDGNKVLVNYSINDNENNNVIIKIYGTSDTFKVYYDEKLDNI